MEVLPQILRYALPVLVAIALLEALLFWLFSKHGGKPYPWRETFASLGVALGQKLKQILLGGVIISLFLGLWSKRLWTVPLDTVWGLLLLFVAVEFVYYWHHRLSHEIRWLWATHAVHHSATHLNFAAALRLGWTGEISGGALLFFPLVLAGFHPIGMMAALGLNLLYQFWIHSEWAPRLGWVEGVLNTPSNHRVHHASNTEYLDQNYGGVLIIFDRLFGTYTPERDNIQIRYGLVKKLQSNNPITIALHEWAALVADIRQARGLREIFMYLFGPPGWHPEEKPPHQTQ